MTPATPFCAGPKFRRRRRTSCQSNKLSNESGPSSGLSAGGLTAFGVSDGGSRLVVSSALPLALGSALSLALSVALPLALCLVLPLALCLALAYWQAFFWVLYSLLD